MPAIAAMIEPLVVVFRILPELMFEMAKEVVVALVKSDEPVSVVEAMMAERFAESAPPMLRSWRVEEPVTVSADEVAPVVVRPPLKEIWVVVALLGKRYPKVV